MLSEIDDYLVPVFNFHTLFFSPSMKALGFFPDYLLVLPCIKTDNLFIQEYDMSGY